MSKVNALRTVALRSEVRALSAEAATDIRDAYYKAAEGLEALKEALEATDLPADEVATVRKALAALDNSRLGAVL